MTREQNIAEPKKMNHLDILAIIPHRYPFLLLDGILESDGSQYAIGYKNVTLNEACVYGSSPAKPRFPETLITEAMAQVGVAAVLNDPENRGKLMLFAAADNLRFHKKVYPGDQLVSRVDKVFMKSGLGKMKAKAMVNGELVAEGEFTFALTKKI